ncbi:uncharacterized protein [Triticum aestivum]|uniref:uncharacterized protein isoform X1 n=1 Tax=Triticum aestivum TaxID=4565 RepID=UPI001D00B197|nr:uncharacterized protein LOC123047703 isoform X1 [Triticum aestivum]
MAFCKEESGGMTERRERWRGAGRGRGMKRRNSAASAPQGARSELPRSSRRHAFLPVAAELQGATSCNPAAAQALCPCARYPDGASSSISTTASATHEVERWWPHLLITTAAAMAPRAGIWPPAPSRIGAPPRGRGGLEGEGRRPRQERWWPLSTSCSTASTNPCPHPPPPVTAEWRVRCSVKQKARSSNFDD